MKSCLDGNEATHKPLMRTLWYPSVYYASQGTLIMRELDTAGIELQSKK